FVDRRLSPTGSSRVRIDTGPRQVRLCRPELSGDLRWPLRPAPHRLQYRQGVQPRDRLVAQQTLGFLLHVRSEGIIIADWLPEMVQPAPVQPATIGFSNYSRGGFVDAQDPLLTHLNWYWITLEVLIPPVVALLLAYPFWRKGGMIFGNIVGTAVMFATAFGLI